MAIEKRFWKPTITSQFTHCPVPYHLDSYKGVHLDVFIALVEI